MNVAIWANHGPNIFGVSDNLHHGILRNSLVTSDTRIHALQ